MSTYFIIGLFITSIDYTLMAVFKNYRYDTPQFIASVVIWPLAILSWLNDIYRYIKRGRA